MKAKVLLLSATAMMGAIAPAMAQTGVEAGSPFGHGEDSIRCIQNISLFIPYAKSDNFKDALIPWEEAYNECPAANRNTFIYGVKIVNWQIENEKDPAKKQELVDKLMKVYDDYVTYFGDRQDFPAPQIEAKRAIEYLGIMGGKSDFQKVYDWLKGSIDELQAAEKNPLAYYYFMQAADIQYKRGKLTKEQYINDYLSTAKHVEDFIASSTSAANAKYAEANVLPQVNLMFANSGAADCETLENVYGPKIEENKEDLEFLKKTIELFRKVNCVESDSYFAASAYMHVIEPTVESSVGMASQALKAKDNDKAITYFEQAISLATDDNDKADAYYHIAAIEVQKGSYVAARQAAREAIKLNPKDGNSYMLIANMYANSGRSVYPNDPILAQTVFYAAVDKLQQAINADPSVAGQARQLMGNYKANYPSKQNIFMHGDIEAGQSFVVGGWIQERVVIK